MDCEKKASSRLIPAAAIAAVVFLTSACARFEESGLPGSASSMARNQIMLVRAEPSTFGHYRMTSHMRMYPDLEFFVSKRGLPDFLAETQNDDQQYLILYYLRERQAFAARNRRARPRNLEFAGPYPITDKEFKMLEGLRQNHKD
jgi:hypothetical protein